ncbi:hypothetical protein F8388_027085 [Cannabis sativa]|uniref:BAH domain-containing protein n=1 Tax=Cannabis sativa TaxID=3483 RepID=A0A7J6GY22_CANSA|nr:hypothetical protein F8388_027085 [Cannabis sativa]KAF4387823.1 hypothetical protein G4B88_004150 [Cannabis sativa]
MLGWRMDNEVGFKWGTKIGNGVRNKDIQFFNSFTLRGIEYSLYDCVCFYSVGNPETYIGKLVKILETPNHERKVKVVWLFRPTEIRNYLGNAKPQPQWNELFLASGQGKGLFNFNDAENVVGKCNVICTSDDKRNPQPSEEELRKAHYIYYRTFDVGKTEISEKFPDEICGSKVEFFFNQRKYQRIQKPKIKIRHEYQLFTESPSPKLNKGVDIPCKIPSPASRNGSLVKESENVAGKASLVEHGCGSSSSDSAKLKYVAVEGGSEPDIQIKDRVRSLEMISPEKTSHSQPYKKRIIALYDKSPAKQNSGETPTKTFAKAVPEHVYDKSVPTNNHVLEASKQPGDVSLNLLANDKSRVRFSKMFSPDSTSHSQPYKKRIIALEKSPAKQNSGETAIKTPVKSVPQHAFAKSVSKNNHVLEVSRQPNYDRRSWFKQQPWEEKLQKAQETESLVLLENLDPSFSSVEVEDLIWHAFNERVEARMVQFGTFSNSPYAKAFVLFKSKVAAQSAICKWNSSFLILPDGRPVVGRQRNLRVSDQETTFAGHLALDRFKVPKQREDQRNAVAVSTAHCTQTNTFEFDLAMQWRELQEKTDLWWKTLHEKQRKEENELKSQLKLKL